MNWFDQRPDDAMAGAFEAIAPEPVVAVEAPIFREAMSLYGSAVHVVTTDGPGGKTGFTGNGDLLGLGQSADPARLPQPQESRAVRCSPPTGCSASTHSAPGRRRLSNVFAGRTGATLADRFQVGDWTTLATGAPVLNSAIVACDCRVVEIKAVASHNVIFGVVEAVHLGTAGPALVYHGRVYKSV